MCKLGNPWWHHKVGIVVCVDGVAPRIGAEFAKCTYLELGIKEAKDQVETVFYMGNQSYVDKNASESGMELRWMA